MCQLLSLTCFVELRAQLHIACVKECSYVFWFKPDGGWVVVVVVQYSQGDVHSSTLFFCSCEGDRKRGLNLLRLIDELDPELVMIHWRVTARNRRRRGHGYRETPRLSFQFFLLALYFISLTYRIIKHWKRNRFCVDNGWFCFPTSQIKDWIHLLVDLDCLNRFRCKFVFCSVKNW